MGNVVSSRLRPGFTKMITRMEEKQTSIECLCCIVFALQTGLRWPEIKSVFNKAKVEGEHIILLGEHNAAKEKLFEYFLPLKCLSPGVFQNDRLYYGTFKLKVTSIEGSEEDYIKDSQKTTLLFCHPTTQKPFTCKWEAYSDLMKDQSIDSVIVLTACNCPCENYTNCKIPDDMLQGFIGKPIYFGTGGQPFGYRLFFRKIPTDLLLELAAQIPITGQLIALQAFSICYNAIKMFAKPRQFIRAFRK